MKNIRFVEQKTLTLGQPETIKIPTNNCIRNLILRLAGSITISGGSTSGTVHAQGVARLLSDISVKRNGSDTIFSLPGWLLYELNRILYGTAGSLTNLANGDAQANTAVNVSLIVPFENLRGVKPFDTLMKASGLSSLDLLVNTVAASGVVYGGDRTSAVGTTAFTLRASIEEERFVNNFTFGDLRISLLNKVSVGGASANFQIKPLPVGNMYKGFMLFAEDAGVGSNALISNIKLKSGSEVFADIAGSELREVNKLDKGIETLGTGVYYLDMLPDGMLNSSLDVSPKTGRETLEFELNVAAPGGTAYVYVVGIEYVPPVVVSKRA